MNVAHQISAAVSKKSVVQKMKQYNNIAIKQSSGGFTLIELILYIALVSIFITGAIFFAWDVIYGREKAYQQQIVEQNGRSVLARIAYEIRRAQDINNITSSSIELENGANDTTIELVSGAVQIITGGAGPYDLTSDQVYVTTLNFTDLSSADENTKNINIGLTLRQAQTAVSGQLEAEATMSESVELNGQFNAARALLMDASGATLDAEEVHDTTLQNSSAANITVDKITVSWTGTAGGEKIIEIAIDGDTVWEDRPGQPSGAELDITNVTLISGADPLGIDKFEFDSDMSGVTVTVRYAMTDGSTTEVVMDFS